MKRSHVLKVGMVLASALSMAWVPCAVADGLTWSAPVKSTLPTLQSVMHMGASSAPVINPPPLPPQGTVNIQANLMCGDQDVNNFTGGVNPSAPGMSKQVEFLQPNKNVSMVLGYWIVDQNGVAAASVTGSNTTSTDLFVPGKGAAWYPLATGSMTVAAANISPQPVLGKMAPINKDRNSPVDIGTIIGTKVNSVVHSIGAASFDMPSAPKRNYVAYFGLMACNNFQNAQSGTNLNAGNAMPDSLEIADFQLALSQGKFASACPSGSQCWLNYSPSGGIVLGLSQASGATWSQKLKLSNNPLYVLGSDLASPGGMRGNDSTVWSGVTSTMASNTCSTLPGETSRWYEAFPMQVTCETLNQKGFSAASPSAMSGALMAAGIVQEAQNVLASSVQRPQVACFNPGEEYIDQLLASVVIPFQNDPTKGIVALVPGSKTGMTHPEALFADVNFKQDYCTNAAAGCTGSDFNTVFGMVAPPSQSLMATSEIHPLDFLADLLVPQAYGMMYIGPNGADAATAGSTYLLGIGMIKGGTPVTTAVYKGSLSGQPSLQSRTNVQFGIPVAVHPATEPIVSQVFPNGLQLTVNIRATGSGAGCPVKFCKADEEPHDSLFE